MRYIRFMITCLLVFVAISSVPSAPLAEPSGAGSCSLGDIRLQSSMGYVRLEAPKGKCYDRRSGETKYVTLSASGSESLQIFVSTIQDGRYFETDGFVRVRQDPGESDSYRITFMPSGAGTFTTAIPVTYGYAMHALRDYHSCLDQKLGKPVEGWKQAVSRLESESIDYSAVVVRMQQIAERHQEQLKPREAEIVEANEELAALIREKPRVLEEMRKGLYCNQCWRSKTEIEKNGEKFEQHLRDVKGDAVPAPPEKIAAKEREYDQKIANARARVSQLRTAYANEHERLRQSREVQEVRERKALEQAHARVLEQLRRKLQQAEQAYEQGMKAYERKEAERKVVMIRVEGVCEK